MSEEVRIGDLATQLEIPSSRLRRMADAGLVPVVRVSEGGHRYFDPSAVRRALALQAGGVLGPEQVLPTTAPEFEQTFGLAALAEDKVWELMAVELPDGLATGAKGILQYAVTELVNNAIDHSGGRVVQVSLWTVPSLVARISDDGEGAFSHLQKGLALADDLEAIGWFTKGRQTTAPDKHTGEGIFFTSKAVDVFRLSSNGLRWTVDNTRNDDAVGISHVTEGTEVIVQLDPEAPRTLREVFSQFTKDGAFVRTRPRVKLFELGRRFVSRSEAKRLLGNLDDFTELEIDFDGVEEVGQGFVDELLRVWPREHPGVTISPVNMNRAVEWMVNRATRSLIGR